MAPNGPRGGPLAAGRGTRGGSSLNSRPSTRGGIQKRRGPSTRMDVDGDLDMGTTGSAKGPRRGNGNTSGPDSHAPRQTRTMRSGTPLGKGQTKATDAILRHLQGDGTAIGARITRASRTQTQPLVYFKVSGLKESKAARNAGGGLRDLLTFLERKASGRAPDNRTVTIKKVS
jgi:nuclear RNA export factor